MNPRSCDHYTSRAPAHSRQVLRFGQEALAELRHELQIPNCPPRVSLVKQLLRPELLALVAVEREAAISSHFGRDRGEAVDRSAKPLRKALDFSSEHLRDVVSPGRLDSNEAEGALQEELDTLLSLAHRGRPERPFSMAS